ncbi:uncharacterized protein [Physcomitrium patens]|nr:flocculation protein FLO11-like isoform X2 [Physcomitrium patens]|eukprot:XP_024357952.1 flocculation protein FLO11-like isoform X2 [Physcomitrella patens]
MMDDAHNSRLRERSKKDGSGVTSSHGAATSIVGGSSRNKRKRPSSQEKVVHGRSSPAEEVEETTEDTEMGGSEDDDDHPPPIIPRRSGKSRPQAKFAEDGNAVDLPAVPRKARTAIGKRPHEASTPPVAESPGHTGGVGGGAAAPSSTVSSSSIASLKAEKRTKPSASKQRAHKLPKVSALCFISEQEVEVAEALFDLARMFTQPLPAAVESKPEAKAADLPKLDPNHETKASPSSASIVTAHVSNGAAVVLSSSIPTPASGPNVNGSVKGSSPGVLSTPSPIRSPPLPTAALAEAAKRKRPRVTTRTGEGGLTQSRAGPTAANAALSSVGSGAAQAKDANQSTSQASIPDGGAVKTESSGTVAPPVCASAASVAVAACGMADTSSVVATTGATAVEGHDGAVGGTVPRTDKTGAERKVVESDKKLGPSSGNAEVASSICEEKREEGSPVREKKGTKSECADVAGAVKSEVDPMRSTSAGVNAVITKVELERRSPAAGGPSDADRVPKREIDLMVPPSKLEGASSSEKGGESGNGDEDVRGATEKASVDAAVAAAADSASAEREGEGRELERAEMERRRAQEEEMDREIEKEKERQGVGERSEREQRREGESQKEVAEETVKEREKEKDKVEERAEASKAGVQRSSKSTKMENGRVQKAERGGNGASAATFVGCAAGGGPDAAGVGGNVAVVPMSMGMLGWHAGMAGYYPAAAAAVATAAGGVGVDSSPAVQV